MRKIGLIDRNFAHAKKENGFDSVCKLPTSTFQWERDIAEIFSNESIDILVFTDECLHEVIQFQSLKKKKIAWLLEPMAISSNHFAFSAQYHTFFDFVVSSDLEFVKRVPNAIFAPFGSTWIDPADWFEHEKTRLVSMISSKKMMTSGHNLRFEVAKLLDQSDLYGEISGRKIEKKIDGLRDYKFSVVIENCSRAGYFTEKIVDCFLTATVPIYWGCQDIDSFFDARGILKFENAKYLEEMLEDKKAMSEFYEKNFSFVQKNLKTALQFVSADECFVKSVVCREV